MDLADIRRSLEVDDDRIRAAATFHDNLAQAYAGPGGEPGPFAEIAGRGGAWERHGRVATEYRLAAEWWALIDPYRALSSLWHAGAHYLETGARDAHGFGVYVLTCLLPLDSRAHARARDEVEKGIQNALEHGIDHPVQATYLELAAIGMGFARESSRLAELVEPHGLVNLGPSGLDRRAVRRWLVEPSLSDPELFQRSRVWSEVIAENRSAEHLWRRLLPRQSLVDLDEVIPLAHALGRIVGPNKERRVDPTDDIDSFVEVLRRLAEVDRFDPGLAAVNVVVAAALAEARASNEWYDPPIRRRNGGLVDDLPLH